MEERTEGEEEQLRLLEVLECHESVEWEVEHHFVSSLVQHTSRIGIIALELDRRVVELTLNFVTTHYTRLRCRRFLYQCSLFGSHERDVTISIPLCYHYNVRHIGFALGYTREVVELSDNIVVGPFMFLVRLKCQCVGLHLGQVELRLLPNGVAVHRTSI